MPEFPARRNTAGLPDSFQTINKAFQGNAISGTRLAVVSPCSSCRNRYNDGSDQDLAARYPVCPRAWWRKYGPDQKTLILNADAPSNDLARGEAPAHLLLPDASRETSPDAWRNPVQSDPDALVAIWIAPLSSNSGNVDENGVPVNFSILRSAALENRVSWNTPGGYDTRFTACLQLPAIPDATVKDIQSGTRFAEGKIVAFSEFDAGMFSDRNLTSASFSGTVRPVDPLQLQNLSARPSNNTIVPT